MGHFICTSTTTEWDGNEQGRAGRVVYVRVGRPGRKWKAEIESGFRPHPASAAVFFALVLFRHLVRKPTQPGPYTEDLAKGLKNQFHHAFWKF